MNPQTEMNTPRATQWNAYYLAALPVYLEKYPAGDMTDAIKHAASAADIAMQIADKKINPGST